MKIAYQIARVLLILLLLTPILGVSGLIPGPTADLYTPSGWTFMSALIGSGYMMPLIAIMCAFCIFLLVTGRSALAAVVLVPFTINVICFHAFVDTGLLHPAASLGILLFVLNTFFLWLNWGKYKKLW